MSKAGNFMKLLISINFEEEIKNILHNHMKGLTDKCEKGAFTPKDNIHLSLVYVGETTQIGAVVETMDAIDSEWFDITLADNGKFRRSGGEVYWVGIDKSPELVRLQKILYRSLVRKGVVREKNEFKPHLTVSRETVVDKDAVPETDFNRSITVKRVNLMKCESSREGITYTEVYAKELAEPGKSI